MEVQKGYWVIGISVVLYLIFYAISFIPRFHGRLFGPALHDQYLRGQVLIQRLNGILILGAASLFVIIAFLKSNPYDYGIAWGSIKALWYILAMVVVILPFNYFTGKTDSNLSNYPKMRFPIWTPYRVTLSLMSWATYLIGYEFFFRGFLFFGCYHAFGLWPAILINVGFYVLAHGIRNLKEAAAAIPFGVLLCFITYDTGSVLAAILIHIFLAWSNELFSIYFHPNMKFGPQKAL